MLDPRTLIILFTLVRIAQSLSLFYVWRTQGQYAPVRYWAIGSALSALGLLLIGLRDMIPLPVSVVVGNGFLLPGWMIFDAGIVKAADCGFPFKVGIPVIATAILGLFWYSAVEPEYLARTIIFNSVIVLFEILTAYSCFRAVCGRRTLTFRIIGVLIGINIVSCLWRAYGAYSSNLQTILAATLPQIQFFLFHIAFSFIVTALLVLLTTQKLQDEVAELARRDTLTKAYNRRALQEWWGHYYSICQRDAACLAVLMADIDHFKDFNDRNGHLGGDEMLAAVSACAEAALRTEDIWCRYGGEEFVALLPHASEDQAAAVAERLRQAIAGLRIAGKSGPEGVTVSFGVASFIPLGQSFGAVLGEADRQLYRSKTAGRNRVSSTTLP
jgi:diguanylate cyclase (GGDEF)-like protein